jgi:hypothetical protein
MANPMRARITGYGHGAVRYCGFSTGSFVEPSEAWDEPRRLKFSVTAHPSPMQEGTPHREIHPPHLTGLLASKQGQFRLRPLPGGRRHLEGTTWYQHRLWPASYWQLWSDHIIHTIHLRVLRQVKALSETGQNSEMRAAAGRADAEEMGALLHRPCEQPADLFDQGPSALARKRPFLSASGVFPSHAK